MKKLLAFVMIVGSLSSYGQNYKLDVNGSSRITFSTATEEARVRAAYGGFGSGFVEGLEVRSSTTDVNTIAYGISISATSASSMTDAAIGIYSAVSSPDPVKTLAGVFVGRVVNYGNWLVSDGKMKENISALPANSMDLINKLKPVSYTFKSSRSLPGGQQTGFIAQDVAEVFPHLVTTTTVPIDGSVLNLADAKTNTKKEEHMLLNYDGMIPYIVRALQEQQAMIDEQKALIQSLVAKVGEQSDVTSTTMPRITNLSPNPATSVLVVDCFTNHQSASLFIYDDHGKVYATASAEEGQVKFSLDAYSPGVYLVALVVKGTTFDVRRFVVGK